jgi:hypothetical protein
VSLQGRSKRLLNADVELMRTNREPNPPATLERVRFGDLWEAKKPAEELARLRLAPPGRRKLNVIQADDVQSVSHESPGAVRLGRTSVLGWP